MPERVRLVLKGEPMGESSYGLTLEAYDAQSGKLISTAVRIVEPQRVLGNVAVVSHPGTDSNKASPALFAFEDWSVAGDAVAFEPSRANGVILGTQYTLTDNVLKMTAQLMPLGEGDPLTAELQVIGKRGWVTADESEVVAPGWTATFRVADWDDGVDTPYRVVYRLPDGRKTHTYAWAGTIRKDPVEKEKIVVAGLSCNHMCSHRLFQTWNGDPASEVG